MAPLCAAAARAATGLLAGSDAFARCTAAASSANAAGAAAQSAAIERMAPAHRRARHRADGDAGTGARRGADTGAGTGTNAIKAYDAVSIRPRRSDARTPTHCRPAP